MADQNREERVARVRERMTPAIEEAIHNSAQFEKMIGPAAAAELENVSRGNLEANLPLPALEAIVQRFGRPPLLIRDDKVVLEKLIDFPAGTDAKLTALDKWIPSVGRVEFVNFRMAWGGTGWVVDRTNGKYRIITNRHVAKLVAARIASGQGVFLRSQAGIAYRANVDFKEEALSPVDDISRTVKLTTIPYIADDLAADIAIFELDSSSFEISPVALSETEAKKDELIALIGYPAFDSRNNAQDQARYFHDLYDVKRMAPGKIMQALSGDQTLMHDATTLGGNSGSPLFSLETGHVVGLHFSGEYGIENSAVGVAAIKKALAGKSTLVQVAGAETEAAADGKHDAAFFAGRKGFETAFLKGGEVMTPWPNLSEELSAGLADPSDNPPEPNELRYTHFGVKYSAERKLPAMTAVNIDGAASVRIKRANDKWFTDGRVSPEIQLGSGNFADLEIDRGHMVRREDPNWGEKPVAELANDDTFHYVNAAAQHSRMNQGKQLWQGLENYILDSSRTYGFQACVFTGPVSRADDEELDGAKVPLEFWKMVATLNEDGSKLHATAYLLSQGQLIRELMEKRSKTEAMEGVVLGEYRTFQIAIQDLADGTGHDFSAYFDADPLKRPEHVEAADGPRFLPLDDLEYVQL